MANAPTATADKPAAMPTDAAAAPNDDFKISQETIPSGLAIIPQRLLKLVGLMK